jgi:hypothetical protein
MKYISFILRSINALKFIMEWNRRTNQPGGKKWKTDYRDRLFQETHANEIEHLQNQLEAHEAQFQIQRLREQFGRKHEKTVTARNHLLKLYNTVCGLYFTSPIAETFSSLGLPFFSIPFGILWTVSKLRFTRAAFPRR